MTDQWARSAGDLLRAPMPPSDLSVGGVLYWKHSCPSGCGHTWMTSDPFEPGAQLVEHDCRP